jgi:nitrogen-specific signal transduction histidine kinase/CheY-like chemotaxis protein
VVRDEASQPKSILTVNTDITEKKQLEAQFLRAQRLESLGTLASGIAHDLNNILTPILAIAPLLPLNLPPLSERSQQLLKMLDENAKRGAELVKQILTFARGLDGERAPVQVKHLLRELEQVIRSTFPKSITIRRHIATQDLWLVSANATQLHQVFMNFCVNARDAMPEGGILTISAENRVIDQIYTQMNLEAKEGSYVVITFTDTGIGIVLENIDRIFEPFFTTKGVGEGTGLGLSTVLGIIKNHGGFVAVSSEVGQGTEFQVFLPAIAGTEPPVARVQELPMGQGELLLIVDDEVNICETLKITLENQNYRVLTAKDGIEAIATCAKHREDIKVVLMDMMMPSMDGSAAIHALQMLNSQIKIIACSGLTVRDPALEVGVKAFLAKPFSADVLLNTLHRVLREAA